jgi:hypothetical protein
LCRATVPLRETKGGGVPADVALPIS